MGYTSEPLKNQGVVDVTADYVMTPDDICVRVTAANKASNTITITPPVISDPRTAGKVYTVCFVGTVGSGETCVLKNPAGGIAAVNSGSDYTFTAENDRAVLAYTGVHVYEIENVTT